MSQATVRRSLLASMLLWAITGLVLVLILGPILAVIFVSFSADDYFVMPPQSYSLRWFVEFFTQPNMRGAFLLSLLLALGSATVATALGVLGAIFVTRRKGYASGALQSLFMAPLVFPTIILGLALLLFYRSIGVPVLPGLILAHVVVCLPYCFRATMTSMQSFDVRLEEAGQSLGAGPVKSFFLITLPIVWPGVLSGWLFAFVVSFGELNVSLFLTGPGIVTLPIEIFSYLQFEGGQLVVAAASTVQVVMIILVVAIMQRLIGLARIVRN